jgi:predicted GNAT family acetyltransferase
MFLFNGVNIGRAKSHPSKRKNSSNAYGDLFTWLAPKANNLLVTPRPDLNRYSPSARARYVLEHLTKTEFVEWRQENVARARWTFKQLTHPTDHMVNKFRDFLRECESEEPIIRHERLRDPRLNGKKASPLMLDILRREHRELAVPAVESIRVAKR